MAFCTKCGAQVQGPFCGKCGAAASAPAAVIIQKTEQPSNIENTEQPTVAFPASQGVSSGTWVRVSPNRWTLKR